MFKFQNPEYFYYLAAIVFLLIVTLFSWKMTQKVFDRAIHPRLRKILTLSVSPGRRKLKLFLQLLCLVFALISLARPQQGQKSEKVKIEGIEIVIALDVSNSMMAEDVKPNRLEIAKRSIEKLLERMSGHKVGLIAFAGSAALISPMTTDYSAIRMFVDSMDINSITAQGTNFKDTITQAFTAFKRGGEEDTETEKLTRVVVIYSDGEDNEPGALDKAKDVASQGIRIFAVGVGTQKGAPIPQRDDFGNLKGYKQDNKGQTVLSKVNTDFMQELGSVGRGGYYHATFSGDEISQIEEDLNKLEKTEFDAEVVKNYDEKFQIPLFLALFFAFLEFSLGEKRKVESLTQVYRAEMKAGKNV